MNLLSLLVIFCVVQPALLGPCDVEEGCLSCSSLNRCTECVQPYTLVDGSCEIVRKILEGDFNFDGIGGFLNRMSITPLTSENEPEQVPSTSSTSPPSIQPITIQNCAYQLRNECILCQVGYRLSNNQCKIKITKCLQLDDDNLCMRCHNQLFLNENGQCMDLRCKQWDFYACTECVDGSLLSEDGFCQDVNCFEVENGTCINCSSSLFPSQNGLCSPLSDAIPNCQQGEQVGSQTQCKKCKDQYFLHNNKCQQICLRKLNSFCILCVGGYLPTVNGSCVRIPEGCAKPTIIQDSIGCLGCQQGYLLVDKCIKIQIAVPFCVQYEQLDCIRCAQGFLISNGKCIKQVQNCARYQDEKCLMCNLNYILSRNRDKCTSRKGCKMFSNSGLCIECRSDYQLSQGDCVEVHQLCSKFVNGKCQSCYGGYTLINNSCLQTFQGNCEEIDRGVCLDCKDNYALVKGNCLTKIDSCVEYSLRSGQCSKCQTGYDLSLGICVSQDDSSYIQRSDINCKRFSLRDGTCRQCFSSFYLSKNKCLQANPLCKTFNPIGGDCLTCFDGYKVENGQCIFGTTATISTNTNCRDYDAVNDVCRECIVRFYRVNGGCSPVSDDCNTYDPDTGLCFSCYDGYILRNGRCALLSRLALTNCLVHSADDLCEECIERFYVQEGICKHVSILCNRYNKDSGKCIDCILGHVMIEGECKQPALGEDKNCALYNSLAFCEACREGYQLVEYKCQIG